MTILNKSNSKALSHFKGQVLTIFIAFFSCFILFEGQAQHIEIKVIDKSTNTAPFSTVYLRNLSDNSVNLAQAFAHDVALDPEAKYEIICGGYTRLTLSGAEIMARKTIYIQPLEYTFGAVQVEKLSKKSVWKIWERTLNNSRKTQHRRNPTNYVHFLSSEQNEKIREVLLCYGQASNNKIEPRFRISAGDFRIQKNNPFYNLHTSFWVLEHSTFQHRPLFNYLPSQMPSSALESYSMYSNSSVSDSLVLIEFSRSDGNLYESVLVNKNTRFPRTSTVIIKRDWLSFRFLGGERARVDSAHIRVDFFPNSFIPEQIHYNITFSDKAPIYVQGFFIASDPVEFKQINVKIGSYQPRHMYEQIIMKRQNLISDKVIDAKLLDSLFLPGEKNESLLLTKLSNHKILEQSNYDDLLEQILVINSSHGTMYKNNQRVQHQNALEFTWFVRLTDQGELLLFPSLFGQSYLLTNNEYWWHRLIAVYCVEYIEHERQKVKASTQKMTVWEQQLDFIIRRKESIDFELKQLLVFPLRYSADYALQYVFNVSKNLEKNLLPVFFQTAMMKNIDMPFEALPSLKLLWSNQQMSKADKQELSRYYIMLHEKSIKQHKSCKILLYPSQLQSMFEEMVWVVDLVEDKSKLCALIKEVEILLNIPSYGACDRN
jgi:hypothetical protein